jgi:hypothetical protein
MSTKKVVDLYISDLLVLEIIILLTKFLAVSGPVRIIVRRPGRNRGRGLSRSAGRVIIGIISTCICCKNNKGFVCLISYFLVVYISAEIILGLVKTLETSN